MVAYLRLQGCQHALLLEPHAGLLPLALGAPQLPMLHSVDFSAFLGVTPRPPQRRLGRAGEGLG